MATKESPPLAMFCKALEWGVVAGGGDSGLVTAGSGGSTTSATFKAGVGELAGGCVSSGTVFSRLPASAGMMLYELSGMELEEHGFPEGDQCKYVSVQTSGLKSRHLLLCMSFCTRIYGFGEAGTYSNIC